MARRTWAAMAMLVLGCETPEYQVELVAGEAAILEQGLGWELSVVRGGCPAGFDGGLAPDESTVARSFRWARGDAGPTIGALSPGRYGLYVRVRDAGCLVRWAGCEGVLAEADGDGRVRIELRAVSTQEPQGCAGPACGGVQSCEAGFCVDGDPAPGGCDDGIECTIDSCGDTCADADDRCVQDESGCVHVPDDGACSSTAEQGRGACDARLGCQVVNQQCDDHEPCTEDYWDSDRGCVHQPLDRDGDGVSCVDDCDDQNPDAWQQGAAGVCATDCDQRPDDCRDTCQDPGVDDPYLFCTQAMSWDGAQLACSALGGRLAIPRDEEEQLQLWAQASQLAADSWWIGVTDLREEGVWAGSDDQQDLGYLGWAEGYPDGGDLEDCAVLGWEVEGRWDDRGCEVSYPWICQLF